MICLSEVALRKFAITKWLIVMDLERKGAVVHRISIHDFLVQLRYHQTTGLAVGLFVCLNLPVTTYTKDFSRPIIAQNSTGSMKIFLNGSIKRPLDANRRGSLRLLK